MNPWFAVTFVVLLGATLVVELIGVASKKDGDTITEGWRWVRDRLPGPGKWFFRVFTAGILVWAMLHFVADVD